MVIFRQMKRLKFSSKPLILWVGARGLLRASCPPPLRGRTSCDQICSRQICRPLLGSNQAPLLRAQKKPLRSDFFHELVGARGFEPPTPATPLQCATRLRHAPTCLKPIISSRLGEFYITRFFRDRRSLSMPFVREWFCRRQRNARTNSQSPRYQTAPRPDTFKNINGSHRVSHETRNFTSNLDPVVA